MFNLAFFKSTVNKKDEHDERLIIKESKCILFPPKHNVNYQKRRKKCKQIFFFLLQRIPVWRWRLPKMPSNQVVTKGVRPRSQVNEKGHKKNDLWLNENTTWIMANSLFVLLPSVLPSVASVVFSNLKLRNSITNVFPQTTKNRTWNWANNNNNNNNSVLGLDVDSPRDKAQNSNSSKQKWCSNC